MKNMRELINLMEGVIAVPGVTEKSTSEQQARFMAAASHDPTFAKKVGIDQDVAKEFNKADTGTKQLSKAMKHVNEGIVLSEPDLDDGNEVDESVPAVNSCRQSNPADAVDACIMETDYGLAVSQALKSFEHAVMNFGMAPEQAFDKISQQLSPEDAQTFGAALEAQGMLDANSADITANDPIPAEFERPGISPNAYYDDTNYPMEGLAADNLPIKYEVFDRVTKEKVAGPFSTVQRARNVRDKKDLEYGAVRYSVRPIGTDRSVIEDLNNGYDDVHHASGNDYFPNGADSPVVSATGPSGARQGDNPEQKKMQVAEVHKELVYGYRNYLKESSKKKEENTDRKRFDQLPKGSPERKKGFDEWMKKRGKKLGIK